MAESEVEMVTETELVELDSLKEYAHNPKKHHQDQIETIKTSIVNYGWDQDIVVDSDGVIIKGHGRFEAAKQLGLQRVPVKWRDGLSPDEVRSARIIDNKSNLDSGFDYDLLALEVDELIDEYSEADIATMTGFSGNDIQDLVDRMGGSIDDLTMGDDFENPADEKESPDHDRGKDDGSTGGRGERRVLYDDEGNEVTVRDEGNGDPPTVDREMECPECGHTFEPSDD